MDLDFSLDNNVWMMGGYLYFGECPFLNHMNGIDFEQLVTRISGRSQVKRNPIMKVNRSGIAQINIKGPLTPSNNMMTDLMGGTSTSEIHQAISQVAQDRKIKGAVLVTNSNGGANSGIDETADLIHEVSQSKPILAHVTGSNCSAAYYLTANANKIFSQSRTNMHGNIGTRLVLHDRSEQFKNEGVKPVIIDTGKNKSIGVAGAEITMDQQQHLQGIANELQGFFEGSIIRNRSNLDINAVNDGSMFLARTAVNNNLIDGVQDIRTTFAMAEKLAMR